MSCYPIPETEIPPGPLFTKWTDVLMQDLGDLVKSRNREIHAKAFPI